MEESAPEPRDELEQLLRERYEVMPEEDVFDAISRHAHADILDDLRGTLRRMGLSEEEMEQRVQAIRDRRRQGQ